VAVAAVVVGLGRSNLVVLVVARITVLVAALLEPLVRGMRVLMLQLLFRVAAVVVLVRAAALTLPTVAAVFRRRLLVPQLVGQVVVQVKARAVLLELLAMVAAIMAQVRRILVAVVVLDLTMDTVMRAVRVS
jgi:hypothetical protein